MPALPGSEASRNGLACDAYIQYGRSVHNYTQSICGWRGRESHRNVRVAGGDVLRGIDNARRRRKRKAVFIRFSQLSVTPALGRAADAQALIAF